MKKKLIIIILIIIISECAAVLGIIAYLTFNSHKDSLETFTVKKLNETTSYNIKAEISLNENVVTIKEDLLFTKPEASLYVYVPSMNKAKTKIIKMTSTSSVKKTTFEGLTLKVDFSDACQNLHVEYEITLSNHFDTLSYSDTFTYLTNFLITPAVMKNHQPLSIYKYPFGDPYVYNTNNYYILFKTNKDYQIAAPGSSEEYSFGANKITIFKGIQLRDFSAVLYKNARVSEEKIGTTRVVYINAEASKNYVNSAFDFATKNIGAYPYESFFVVKAPLNQSGMEFSNMIFLSEKCFQNQNELKRITYHEVFHQWFYGIIGTDQLNEPFFDEGLVNYLAMDFCGDRFSRLSDNTLFKLSLKDYSTRSQYYDLAYNRSADYFHSLHDKLGNNFYAMLQKIYRDKKYQIVYFKDFLNYVNEFSRGN